MAGLDPNPAGLIHSLRRLGETVLFIVQNRLELAAVELGEEKGRLIDALFWLAAFAFFTFMAAIVFTFAAIYLLWGPTGGWIIAVFCVFYLTGAVVTFFSFKRRLKKWPPPFAATLAELKKDQSCLTSRD
jgi:uncharacterized membrane protein YqjE